MAESQSSPAAGFLPPTPTSLNSPVPSLPGASGPSDFLTALPHPRTRALRPNSNKEDMVRNYASAKLMQVARRYVKKFGDPAEAQGDEVVGYTRFADLCADLDAIVNVLWLSGTREFSKPPFTRLCDFAVANGKENQRASRSRSSCASQASSPSTPPPSRPNPTRPSSSSASWTTASPRWRRARTSPPARRSRALRRGWARG